MQKKRRLVTWKIQQYKIYPMWKKRIWTGKKKRTESGTCEIITEELTCITGVVKGGGNEE